MRAKDEYKVDVKSGILMMCEKLNFIKRTINTTKVARETALYFWTPAEIRARSLTGQPCRRHANSVAKKKATPEKADTIMSMLYVHFLE
ncbi:hypothetical protein HPB50_011890 [Hyalomma asiaticum]|uniref:Uncharacterized protein n=1 Tax=Hyalomma asiaticum TaxID=266040 RepID=A0ACB7SXT0_HYAAI|nr:hypothetical protein HPB50_011890 [Hyalomma asiaticum]